VTTPAVRPFPWNFFCDRAVSLRELGSVPGSPAPPKSASLVMTDEILLQFDVIRLIAGSLIALAIALAWILAIKG
jgi:hypothetical protein